MQIRINDYIIDVIITYKNNKNIYMRVKEDLKLYITCHRLVSEKQINKLIKENEKSILRMYESMLKTNNYNDGFHYLGQQYTVVTDDNIKQVQIDDDFIYVKSKKMLDKFYKDECQRIFSKRVKEISQYFPYLPKFTLKIRFMKTRWGVCNRGNNTVTLNSELLKKDPDLLDYVIIHEFSHFKHPNHSKEFWDEVAKYYPNYKLARKRLKEV